MCVCVCVCVCGPKGKWSQMLHLLTVNHSQHFKRSFSASRAFNSLISLAVGLEADPRGGSNHMHPQINKLLIENLGKVSPVQLKNGNGDHAR